MDATLRAPLSLWPRILAIPVTLVVLVAGLWLVAGALAPGYYSSIALAAVWFVAASIAVGRIGGRWPALRAPLRGTFLVTAVVVGAVFAWTTFRDETVTERVATAGGGNAVLADGRFEALAHGAAGTAAIVELADGPRVLTFTGLDTDNGPDLRVYLVAGPVSGDGDVDDFVDLGGLKGNRGDQQYAIPDGVDVDRYSTVVIWCRAFSQAFAAADLRAS